jgi:hypothetical protein
MINIIAPKERQKLMKKISILFIVAFVTYVMFYREILSGYKSDLIETIPSLDEVTSKIEPEIGAHLDGTKMIAVPDKVFLPMKE